MNDYALGTKLRRQILGDLEQGLASDGRRLQALAGDLCGHTQLALLPALNYLVMTPGFSHAASQQPPLPADPRLQLRLQQELNEVFAAAICERMEAVLRGLLGLQNASEQPSQAVAPPPPEPEPEPGPAVNSGGNRGLVAVLSFIAGVLVVGVGGAMAWLLLQTNGPTGEPARSERPGLNDNLTTPAPEASTATEAPPAPELVAQAITSVEQLYNDLSLGNLQAARQRFSGEAADQFDPTFFRQFQRVSVDNLRETARDGSQLTLEGLVTFVYPDGTSQSESRQFIVETATEPALITNSSFVQVMRGRQ